MKEFDEIENLFSSAFEGAEMTPPPSVKEAVDNSLFSRAKGGFFWGYSILFLALISGVVMAYQSVEIQNDSNKNLSFKHAAVDEVEVSLDQSEAESIFKSKKINNHQEMDSDDLKKTENTVVDDSKPAKSSEDIARGEMNEPNQLKRMEQKTDSKTANPQRSNKDLLSNAIFGGNESKVNGTQENLATTSKRNEVKIPNESKEQAESNGSNMNGSNHTDQALEKGIVQVLLLNPPSKFELYPVASRNAIQRENSIAKIEYKTPNRWSLWAYVGGQAGVNTLKSTDESSILSIKEQGGVDLALETNYSFSRRFGAGLGIDYVRRDTKMIRSYVTSDSTVTGGNWVIDNPSQPDSLQDSTYYETYDVTTSNQEVASLTRQTSIGIPVYLTYTIPLSNRFSFRIAAGGQFNYQTFNVQFEDAGLPESSFSKFGVNAMLRPEILYGFNRFGLGVYGKMTYDFNHGVNWSEVRRQRYGFGGGLVLKYKF